MAGASKPSFEQAIAEAAQLKHQPGLQAVAPVDQRRLTVKQPRNLRGSANIDEDLRRAWPDANRWDYVIGYSRVGGVVAFFVEVHPANASNVREIELKFNWLLEWLKEHARKLYRFDSEFHWVASGRVQIPRHTPQYKNLAKLRGRRLEGPAERLAIQ